MLVDARLRQKIADALHGRVVVGAAGEERLALPVALKGDAGEWAVGKILLRRDADHEAGVGVELGAAVLAHAVGDDAALFRRRRHDACRPGTCRTSRRERPFLA